MIVLQILKCLGRQMFIGLKNICMTLIINKFIAESNILKSNQNCKVIK